MRPNLMRTLLTILLLALAVLAALWLPGGRAFAQAAQATLRVDGAGSGALTVGDLVPLTLEVSHPGDTVAILPELGTTWGDFEVRDASPSEVLVNEDGSLTTRQQLVVTLFAPGAYSTPPLPVRITNRTGTTYEVLALPVSLSVDSVLTEPEPPLRDLKAQAEAPGNVAVQAAGGLGLAALAAAGAWLLWRRGTLGRLNARTSMERALGELERLEAQGLVQQGKFKELYLGVSQTVRRHLAREYGVDVEDRTTSELRALLRRLPLPAHAARRLLDLLSECDLVKFAEVTPTPQSADALLEEARAVVRTVSGARQSTAPASSPSPAGGRP
jgi:hypothetical protein